MEEIPLLGADQCGESLGLAPARIEVRPLAQTPYDASLIPEHLAQRYQCLALHVVDDLLFLAMADPTDLLALDDIRLITGFAIEPVATDPLEIAAALRGEPLRIPTADLLTSHFPLQECRVEAHLSGPLASVEVRQRFANLGQQALEACYVFPLPAGAAVHSFRMTVGQRVVEGVVQARAKARQTYAQGQQAGHRVALLEQSRDNVLTAQLGNLPPGEQVTIELGYVERLEQNHCESIFRFPLVVAPRYPAGQPLPQAPRQLHSALFSLSLRLDADGPLQLACSQHALTARRENHELHLELARPHELLDRDFVLRYRQQSHEARATLLTDAEHFLLTVMPPADCERPERPRDVTIVLDRSGSMEGLKWTSAVQATLDFLATLDEGETFRLIAFDDRLETFEEGSLAKARAWLQGLSPRGGTDIALGLSEALAPALPEGREGCVLLITDGQVSNEAEVYALAQGSRRLFTLGIDTAVNDAFLRELARRGRGTCELVTPGEALAEALARLARETGSPLVTEVRLIDRGLNFLSEALNPHPIPDLFPSRPLCLSGRKLGTGGLEVAGKLASGEEWSARVEPTASNNPALALLWARERIRALEHVSGRAQEVEGLALRYRLLSRYTSFVLVDRSEVVNPGGRVETVLQPLNPPADWDTVKDISAQDFGPMDFEEEEEISLDKLRELVDEAPIVRVVNLILSQAINDGASHIHLEPQARSMRVRYRVDGVLHEVMTPPKHIEAPLLARLKSMADLDLTVHCRMQTGSLELVHDGKTWYLGLTFIPTQLGEKAVIALHSADSVALPELLQDWLGRPGLVAVAGSPALLRAAAAHFEQSGLAVATDGVTPARADLDALVVAGYRSELLEVRQGVFAAPGVDALTLLVGLHSQPEVWLRLTGVVAVQRVRRLCDQCRGPGCDHCKMTGYRGCLELLESIRMTPELRRAGNLAEILERSRVDTPFVEQARQALARGETTDREVLRVLPT